jgi:hypothetical protein
MFMRWLLSLTGCLASTFENNHVSYKSIAGGT